MIERIIENWLTNTNEKGYQIPFCQYLISKGYTILHVSLHSQMEQGKDIIAIDNKGEPCAFQLKSGTINSRVWNQIKGEIDDLVEIPINYPLVDKKIMHRPIFVTNGRITPKIIRDIDDRNLRYSQLGYPKLEIITGTELLKRFIEVHGSFLPTEPSDFKLFLELYLSDGGELLNKRSFTDFLETLLFTEKEKKSELKRKIASSVLLSQYVLQSYESKENHISIIEGWTILCSYILSLVEKYKLEEKCWRQSYDIIMNRDESLSNRIISDLLVEMTHENNFRLGKGIPDPYVSPNEIIGHIYQLPEAEIDMSSFLGSSYHLETLVDILVRRNKRTLLNELWRYISYIQKYEFKPSPPWKLFLWQCNMGEEVGSFYKNPQRWKELRAEATILNLNTSGLPNILLKNPYSYYFLLCFPHRLNKHTIKLIDGKYINIA